MEFKAPIPGANFTADTRNYAWHRPPDITNYDEAVDYYLKKMDEEQETELIAAMLQIDVHITTIVSGLLMQGISKGKLPIDLAILIAGPLARYIEIVAKSMNIKYEMGVEDKDRIQITPTLLRASLGLLEDDDEEIDQQEMAEAAMAPEEDAGGLMSAPPPEDATAATTDEQAAMLGDDELEPEMPAEEEVMEEELADGLA